MDSVTKKFLSQKATKAFSCFLLLSSASQAHALISFSAQSRAIHATIADQVSPGVLDEAFESAPDDSTFDSTAFARFDILTGMGGVVDAEASQTSSYDMTSIQAIGSAYTTATGLAAADGVFSSATSDFEVSFTNTTATWVHLTGTLSVVRDMTSSPLMNTIENGVSVELLGPGNVTVFNAFNDEGVGAQAIDQFIFLNPSTYTLNILAFSGEQADELSEITASYNISLTFDSPPSVVPEPSTYAAWLGVIAILANCWRRKFQAFRQ